MRLTLNQHKLISDYHGYESRLPWLSLLGRSLSLNSLIIKPAPNYSHNIYSIFITTVIHLRHGKVNLYRMIIKYKAFIYIFIMKHFFGQPRKPDSDPMLVYCWPTVCDAGLTHNQHCLYVTCLLRSIATDQWDLVIVLLRTNETWEILVHSQQG